MRNPGDRHRAIEKLLGEIESAQHHPSVSILTLARNGVFEMVDKLDKERQLMAKTEENLLRTMTNDGMMTADVAERIRAFTQIPEAATSEVGRPFVDFLRASATGLLNVQSSYEKARAELIDATKESEARKRKLDDMEGLQKQLATLQEQVARMQQPAVAAAVAASSANARLDAVVPAAQAVTQAVQATSGATSFGTGQALITDAIVRHQGIYADRAKFKAELEALNTMYRQAAPEPFNPIAAGLKNSGWDYRVDRKINS